MSEAAVSTHMKDRIIQAATRLFADQGFAATSVQAIADAVGIRKPSLLYHFGSKEELRQAVLENMLLHWKEDLPRVLAAAQRGRDRLNAVLTAMIDFFIEEPHRAKLLVREMLDRPDAMRKLFRKHLHPWTSLLTDYIRMGQEAGRVHLDLDPESYVIQVVTMAVGTVATGNVTAAMLGATWAEPVESQIKELVRIARCALFTPRPT
ncbi:MAG: TetR/AcrR family transcriptional regulator [Deltaproteobacteria bacterium]|nr:TetR/AcrR family transcriptional regulator [Deltaproteobacteria bacterium]